MSESKLLLNFNECSSLFQQAQWGELADRMLQTLSSFSAFPLANLGPKIKPVVNHFLDHFFFFFAQEQFQIPIERGVWFIRFNGLISNLTAISDFGTTDSVLKLLLERRNNFVKILALYSARNSVELDPHLLFANNAKVASLWYTHFFDTYLAALPNEAVVAKLQKHLQFSHPSLTFPEPVVEPYYGSTYIDSGFDREIKRRINTVYQEALKEKETPAQFADRSTKKIAIVSACLSTGHAVYKNQRQYLLALKEKFHVVLFALEPEQDGSLAHEVVPMFGDSEAFVQGQNRLRSGEFRLIYFPDIGMHQASIELANARLAPIQICSYGHSVSTFGAQIDYFVVGKEVEALTLLAKNYSERPLLISGAGIIHEPPMPLNLPGKVPHQGLRIACPWSGQKCNHSLLQAVKKVADTLNQIVTFQFFTGPLVKRHQGYFPFVQSVSKVLAPHRVEVYADLHYPEYMAALSQCDFALDAYHFGGCNSIFDAVLAGVPIVTQRGAQWYNRIGPYALDSLGFSELVAENEIQYSEKFARLARDLVWREELSARLKTISLAESALCDAGSANSFVRAIEFVLQNHEELLAQSSKEAIDIEALESRVS